MIVALVPARGGSKRLPRKNLRPLAGRPLLAHSIAAAKAAPEIGRCVVSTDDAEIAAVARDYGAEVLMRPAELANDTATTASVAQHALERLGAGAPGDVLVTLQPTNPLRPPSLVSDALALFRGGDYDAVVSVTQSQEKGGAVENGLFAPAYSIGIRSQDLPPVYFENGLVYVSRADMVLAGGNLFGKRTGALVVDPLYARADIDTELDFEIAEFLFEKYRSRFALPSAV
ncbi:MAG TPA: acylneuraminate cytidylyltransferase family protein [Thermoanaerobaculia bacterium]|jgi:N-acylneuraminate cytidylyltransferase